MALPNNWAQQILRGIGAPVTRQNLRFLAAWQRAEGGGTANNANWNPLNTTQSAPGAGSINSVGVRSYRTPQQGIRATVATLLNGHYGDIVSGLRSGRASADQLARSSSLSTWGTGSGVLRVLGSGGALSPAKGVAASRSLGLASKLAGREAAPGGATAPSGPTFKDLAVQLLLQNANDLAKPGSQSTGTEFLTQLAQARQFAEQASAPAVNVASKVRSGGGGAAPAAKPSGHVNWSGDMNGLNQGFVNKVGVAVRAIGGTRIRIHSGYRSPEHNRAVGGASDSNHTYGRAIDGDAYIPGRGWVPLGAALRGVAPKYGLRSGATFTWGGRPDIVHVDDGYNQHPH